MRRENEAKASPRGAMRHGPSDPFVVTSNIDHKQIGWQISPTDTGARQQARPLPLQNKGAGQSGTGA